MKLSGNWLILSVVVATLVLGSCFDPPTYSPIPLIDFNDMYFAKGSVTDTLSVSVKFKDGDGDIGLAQADTLTPYNNKFYPRQLNNQLITYKLRRTPSYDTLPAYVKPYYCTNWEIRSINKKLDTVYFQLNPNYYNIFVDFYIQNGQTLEYELFDLETQFAGANCGLTYDGRLPVLAKDLSRKSALEGVIRYNMKSQAFLAIFGSKAFKLRITIQDRALHKSNTLETKADNLVGWTKK
jgi:hypothetical protein